MTLRRPMDGGSLGLTICGPTTIEDESAGVFVASLADGSPASTCGSIMVGDQIVRINEHDVRLATVEDALSLLKQSGNEVSITLATNTEGFAQYRNDIHQVAIEIRSIVLNSPACDFGFTLVGGADQQSDVFFGVVHAGGVAEKDGRLLVGDQLVAINQVEVDGMLLEQASPSLQSAPQLNASAPQLTRRVWVPVLQIENLLLQSGGTVELEVVENAEGFVPFAKAMATRKMQVPLKLADPSEERMLELPSSQPLGFTIVGMSNDGVGIQRSGVFVASVEPGSAAEAQGLVVGDQLLQVNGNERGLWRSTRTCSRQEASTFLEEARACGETYAIVVVENVDGFVMLSEAANGARRRLHLTVTNPGQLGCTLVGPQVRSEDPDHRGVFVVLVDSTGPAQAAGLEVGLEVLDVASHNLAGLLHEEVQGILACLVGEVALVVNESKAAYDRAAHVQAFLNPAQSSFRPRNSQKGSHRSRVRSSAKRLAPDGRTAYPALPFFLRALFSFEGKGKGYLSFNQRDILKVLDVKDRNWWMAEEVQSGATGLIPSRYRRETDFMMTKEWVELCRKSEKLTNDKRRLTVTNRVRAS